jgi:hypothetical protein
VSLYDNNNSTIGKGKYTLVAYPLRTKITTGRPMHLGKSPSMSFSKLKEQSMMHQPEETLAEMKQLLQNKKDAVVVNHKTPIKLPQI